MALTALACLTCSSLIVCSPVPSRYDDACPRLLISPNPHLSEAQAFHGSLAAPHRRHPLVSLPIPVAMCSRRKAHAVIPQKPFPLHCTIGSRFAMESCRCVHAWSRFIVCQCLSCFACHAGAMPLRNGARHGTHRRTAGSRHTLHFGTDPCRWMFGCTAASHLTPTVVAMSLQPSTEVGLDGCGEVIGTRVLDADLASMVAFERECWERVSMLMPVGGVSSSFTRPDAPGHGPRFIGGNHLLVVSAWRPTRAWPLLPTHVRVIARWNADEPVSRSSLESRETATCRAVSISPRLSSWRLQSCQWHLHDDRGTGSIDSDAVLLEPHAAKSQSGGVCGP